MEIDGIKLTDIQVLEIVKEWYVGGMYPDILQNESGWDLEEIIEDELDGFPVRDEVEISVSRKHILKVAEDRFKKAIKDKYTN